MGSNNMAFGNASVIPHAADGCAPRRGGLSLSRPRIVESMKPATTLHLLNNDPLLDLAEEGAALIDDVYQLFLEGQIDEAMPVLIGGLSDLRARLSSDGWRTFIEAVCQPHPLSNLLLDDPFTQRAFSKPRGYPGDAVMLDYVYVGDQPDALRDVSISPVGREVYRQLNRNPTVQAVRERKRFTTRVIDEVTRAKPDATIFSVASGHMREIQESVTLAESRFSRLLGLDQDAQSLELVQRELGPLGVETMHASVLQLLRAGMDVGRFDLIYSMGLYDYLRAGLASALTRALFSRLEPGGRLVIANFHRDTPGAGYMEAFMDWWLIHRSNEELLSLAEGLPASEVASIRVIPDDYQTVVTLEIVRAG